MTPNWVYCLTCRANGKMYIGITKNTVEWRWGKHVSAAQLTPRKLKLLNAIRHHGASSFDVTPLFRYPTRTAACDAEIALIAALDTVRCGYNLTHGGDAPEVSEETRAKISAAHKGRPHSPTHIANQAAATRGVERGPRSSESVAKMVASMRGRRHSPEAITRMSEAQRKRGPEGYKRTAEKLRGRPRPPEVKEKLRLANLGKKSSPETRAKIAAASRMKDPAQCAAHAEAMKRAWARRRAEAAFVDIHRIGVSP